MRLATPRRIETAPVVWPGKKPSERHKKWHLARHDADLWLRQWEFIDLAAGQRRHLPFCPLNFPPHLTPPPSHVREMRYNADKSLNHQQL